MTDERPQPSEPIRVDDLSEAPRPAPSTRSAVRESNPAVADNTTLPGEQNPARVAQQHQPSREAAMEHAQRVREELTQVASQTPPSNLPEQPAPQSAPSSLQQPLEADLSLLVTRGRIEDETTVGGFKFQLRTLTSKDNAEAMASVSYVTDDWSRFSHMTIAVLARSIVNVNGIPLENLYQGQEELTALQKREEIVGGWQQGMVGQLFDKYSDMIERSNKAFNAVDDGAVKN